MTTMGDKIRTLRRQRGLTQEELGERLLVNKATISMYEHDAIDIKSSVIIELADALRTKPGYFFGDYSGRDNEAVGVILDIRDIVNDFFLPAS